MTKEAVIEILGKLQVLKKKTGIEIVDTHVHPGDVMGVVHYSEKESESNHLLKDYLESGILEKFNYNKFEKFGSRIVFKIFPGFVNKTIQQTYGTYNNTDLSNEMTISLVDKSVLLPIEPWLPTKIVGDIYKDKKNFIILGSIDVHGIERGDIEKIIISYIQDYKIVGLKFHPNLQDFKPQPKDNLPEIADKLRVIYNVAQKYKLYLIFHGGISNFTEHLNLKYHDVSSRSHTNALLKNFCSADGQSELFENWNMPIIIAHLGHYGMIDVDYGLLELVTKRFNNVCFDTSGISSNVITKALQVVPSERIVFGSDAAYNRMAYNLAFLYNAIVAKNNNEVKTEILVNIFSRNFYNRILRY